MDPTLTRIDWIHCSIYKLGYRNPDSLPSSDVFVASKYRRASVTGNFCSFGTNFLVPNVYTYVDLSITIDKKVDII